MVHLQTSATISKNYMMSEVAGNRRRGRSNEGSSPKKTVDEDNCMGTAFKKVK